MQLIGPRDPRRGCVACRQVHKSDGVRGAQDVTDDLESKVVTIAFSEQTANETRFHEAVRQAGGRGVEV